MTDPSKTALMKIIVPVTVFVATAIISFSSYGQAKVEKLDKLISTYAEYATFNGSVLVADKGKVIY